MNIHHISDWLILKQWLHMINIKEVRCPVAACLRVKYTSNLITQEYTVYSFEKISECHSLSPWNVSALHGNLHERDKMPWNQHSNANCFFNTLDIKGTAQSVPTSITSTFDNANSGLEVIWVSLNICEKQASTVTVLPPLCNHLTVGVNEINGNAQTSSKLNSKLVFMSMNSWLLLTQFRGVCCR